MLTDKDESIRAATIGLIKEQVPEHRNLFDAPVEQRLMQGCKYQLGPAETQVRRMGPAPTAPGAACCARPQLQPAAPCCARLPTACAALPLLSTPRSPLPAPAPQAMAQEHATFCDKMAELAMHVEDYTKGQQDPTAKVRAPGRVRACVPRA